MKAYIKPWVAVTVAAPVQQLCSSIGGTNAVGNGTQYSKNRDDKDIDQDNVANGWVDGLW